MGPSIALLAAFSLPPLALGLGLAVGGALLVAVLGQGTRRASLAGLAVAACLVLGFGPGIVAPLALFVLGAGGLTKLGRSTKESRGVAEKNEGRRSVAHVVAKLGLPAALGLLAAAWPETRSLGAIAATGALAGAFADTAATEVGPLAGGTVVKWKGIRLERAPHGATGGMSLAGLLAGAAAAVATGMAAWAAGVLGGGATALLAGVAGTAAGLAESAIGATAWGDRLGHFGRNVFVSAVSAGLAAGAAWGFAGGEWMHG